MVSMLKISKSVYKRPMNSLNYPDWTDKLNKLKEHDNVSVRAIANEVIKNPSSFYVHYVKPPEWMTLPDIGYVSSNDIEKIEDKYLKNPMVGDLVASALVHRLSLKPLSPKIDSFKRPDQDERYLHGDKLVKKVYTIAQKLGVDDEGRFHRHKPLVSMSFGRLNDNAIPEVSLYLAQLPTSILNGYIDIMNNYYRGGRTPKSQEFDFFIGNRKPESAGMLMGKYIKNSTYQHDGKYIIDKNVLSSFLGTEMSKNKKVVTSMRSFIHPETVGLFSEI